MAGNRAGFRADTFRTAIASVYDMATPTGTGEQVTFHFPKTVTVTAPHDGEAVPFDPTATVTRAAPTTKQVSCLVVYVDNSGQATPFGTVVASRVRIDLLDTQYAQVKTASHVIIRGDTYLYDYEPPAVGLFDVTVHSIFFKAVNET